METQERIFLSQSMSYLAFYDKKICCICSTLIGMVVVSRCWRLRRSEVVRRCEFSVRGAPNENIHWQLLIGLPAYSSIGSTRDSIIRRAIWSIWYIVNLSNSKHCTVNDAWHLKKKKKIMTYGINNFCWLFFSRWKRTEICYRSKFITPNWTPR